MGTIIVTKNIAASADRAWAALADFGNIANFHPGLSGSHLLDGSAANGVGAERRCDIKDGNYLVERVRDWHEGQSYTIDIIESSMPVRRATATLSVKPIDAHHSQAAMVVDMTMTSPACPAGPQLIADTKRALSQRPDVSNVEVRIVMDPPWTPDRMTESARDQLGIF